jgi:hypothetical protein
MISDLWYKNAVIYCLSVGTYMDSNGDGIGDFKGLTRRKAAPRARSWPSDRKAAAEGVFAIRPQTRHAALRSRYPEATDSDV